MGETMNFPDTVDEFMDMYKIVDVEDVYTNGIDMIPIFRMRQWLDHVKQVNDSEVEDLKYHINYLEKKICMLEGYISALRFVVRCDGISGGDVNDTCEKPFI